MTAQPTLNENLDWNWGVPDWCDENAYLAARDLTVRQWRWEFKRRRPSYREDWVRWFWQTGENIGKNEARVLREESDGVVISDFVLKPPVDGTSSMIKDPSRQYSDRQLQYEEFVGPKAPRRTPKRNAQPRQLRGFDFAIDPDGQYYESGDWHFDLTQPLPAQFAIAKATLTACQKELYGKQNMPKPRQILWPLYLRALDAKDAGASYILMARTFWPDYLDKKTPQSARDVYQAAVVLRNNFPF